MEACEMSGEDVLASPAATFHQFQPPDAIYPPAVYPHLYQYLPAMPPDPTAAAATATAAVQMSPFQISPANFHMTELQTFPDNLQTTDFHTPPANMLSVDFESPAHVQMGPGDFQTRGHLVPETPADFRLDQSLQEEDFPQVPEDWPPEVPRDDVGYALPSTPHGVGPKCGSCHQQGAFSLDHDGYPVLSRSPVLLSCGHTLCSHCLKSELVKRCVTCHGPVTEEDRREAPSDVMGCGLMGLRLQEPHQLRLLPPPDPAPARRTRRLRSSRNAMGGIDLLLPAPAASELTLKCSSCHSSCGDVICEECFTPHCHACFFAHPAGSHTAIPVRASPARACHTHVDKKTDLVCDDCDGERICIVCACNEHKGHSFSQASSVLTDEQFADKLCQLRSRQGDVSRSAQLVGFQMDNLEREARETGERLNRTYLHLINRLQLRLHAQHRALQQETGEKIQQLARVRNTFCALRDNLSTIVCEAEKVLAPREAAAAASARPAMPDYMVDLARSMDSLLAIPACVVRPRDAVNQVRLSQPTAGGEFDVRVEFEGRCSVFAAHEHEAPPNWREEDAVAQLDVLHVLSARKRPASSAREPPPPPAEVSPSATDSLAAQDADMVDAPAAVVASSLQVGSRHRISVTHVMGADRFDFVLCEDWEQMKGLSEKLTALCEDGRSLVRRPEPAELREGLFVLAKFHVDGKWYRAAVLTHAEAEEGVQVRFIDYGNCGKCALEDVRIPAASYQLSSRPPFALPGRVSMFSAGTDLRPTSRTAKKVLRSLVANKALHATVEAVDQEDGGGVMHLTLTETPPNYDVISIAHALAYTENLPAPPGGFTPQRVTSPRPFNFPLDPGAAPALDVLVTLANSPSDLFAQVATRNTEDVFSTLPARIEAFIAGRRDPHLPVLCPQAGIHCLALFNEDGCWYRARITRVLPHRRMQVFFIDFGNLVEVGLSEVLMMPLDILLEYPLILVHCGLHGVKPWDNTKWSTHAVDTFRKLCLEHKFTLVVKQRGQQDQVLVDLKPLMTEKTIIETLVELRIARRERRPLEEAEEEEEESVVRTSCFSPSGPTLRTEHEVNGGVSDRFMPVVVSWYRDPHAFAVRRLEPDGSDPLIQMRRQLKQTHLPANTSRAEAGPLLQGTLAVYKDPNSVECNLERCQVVKILDADQYECLLIDHGNTVTAHSSHLLPMEPQLDDSLGCGQSGPLAERCALEGVQPAGGGRVWTKSAIECVQWLVEMGTQFYLDVRGEARGGGGGGGQVNCDLKFVRISCEDALSPETRELLSLADHLKDQGLALSCQRLPVSADSGGAGGSGDAGGVEDSTQGGSDGEVKSIVDIARAVLSPPTVDAPELTMVEPPDVVHGVLDSIQSDAREPPASPQPSVTQEDTTAQGEEQQAPQTESTPHDERAEIPLEPNSVQGELEHGDSSETVRHERELESRRTPVMNEPDSSTPGDLVTSRESRPEVVTSLDLPEVMTSRESPVEIVTLCQSPEEVTSRDLPERDSSEQTSSPQSEQSAGEGQSGGETLDTLDVSDSAGPVEQRDTPPTNAVASGSRRPGTPASLAELVQARRREKMKLASRGAHSSAAAGPLNGTQRVAPGAGSVDAVTEKCESVSGDAGEEDDCTQPRLVMRRRAVVTPRRQPVQLRPAVDPLERRPELTRECLDEVLDWLDRRRASPVNQLCDGDRAASTQSRDDELLPSIPIFGERRTLGLSQDDAATDPLLSPSDGPCAPLRPSPLAFPVPDLDPQLFFPVDECGDSLPTPVLPATTYPPSLPPLFELVHFSCEFVHDALTLSGQDLEVNPGLKDRLNQTVDNLLAPIVSTQFDRAQLYTGMAVCAKYLDAWYRASLLRVLDDGRYEVRFVDFGNHIVVSQDAFRPCAVHTSIPQLALHCVMHGVSLAPHLTDARVQMTMTHIFNTLCGGGGREGGGGGGGGVLGLKAAPCEGGGQPLQVSVVTREGMDLRHELHSKGVYVWTAPPPPPHPLLSPDDVTCYEQLPRLAIPFPIHLYSSLVGETLRVKVSHVASPTLCYITPSDLSSQPAARQLLAEKAELLAHIERVNRTWLTSCSTPVPPAGCVGRLVYVREELPLLRWRRGQVTGHDGDGGGRSFHVHSIDSGYSAWYTEAEVSAVTDLPVFAGISSAVAPALITNLPGGGHTSREALEAALRASPDIQVQVVSVHSVVGLKLIDQTVEQSLLLSSAGALSID